MRMFAGYQEHPAAVNLPLLSDKELEGLTDSIRQIGLQEPILVLDGRILDGRNRAIACERAGVRLVTKTITTDDPFKVAWDRNAHRRHWDQGRRAAAWIAHNEAKVRWMKEQAKAQGDKGRSEEAKAGRVGRAASVQSRPTLAATKPRGDHTTRRASAKESGVSTGTMQKAESLATHDKEALGRVVRGESNLNQEYRRVMREAATLKIVTEPTPLPSGPFRVLVVDPPWAYTKRKDDGTHRAALTYPTMTTDEICAMGDSVDGGSGIKDVSHEDSILWLWTTNAFMRDAFVVLDAWGFREKTILTWAKNKMGTGDWLRGKTEHCILAIKGSPLVTLTNETTLLNGLVREHSRKPVEFYELVERLCPSPPGGRLEVFGRERRDGWVTWGAESEKFGGAA